MMKNLENNIQSLVNQWIEKTDIFVVEIKVTGSKTWVYIDKPEGITIEECSSLSRHLMNELEGDVEFEARELEVSSPGMDQPLKVVDQYKRRIGRELDLKLIDGTSAKGLLKAVNVDGIEILQKTVLKQNKKKITQEDQRKLLFNDIKEAKLVLTFKFK